MSYFRSQHRSAASENTTIGSMVVMILAIRCKSTVRSPTEKTAAYPRRAQERNTVPRGWMGGPRMEGYFEAACQSPAPP